jgi:hypothetical protein
MGNPNEIKKAIEQRLAERMEEIDGPELEDIGDAEPESWDFTSIISEGTVPPSDEDWPEEEFELGTAIDEGAVAMAAESGYAAFLDDVPYDSNPFTTDPDILESLDEDDQAILADTWNEGWAQANHDSWMAEVILTARQLVESTSQKDAEWAMLSLQAAVEALGQTIDYDEYSAFWGFEQ